MAYPTIRTPRGTVHVTPNMKAELTWNPKYKRRWGRKFIRTQMFVDSEVLRLCEPYIPLLTGMLVQSGILGTHVGSGTVKWIAPYAAAQYYMERKNPSKTGPLRGPYWFERMKEVWKDTIIQGARKMFASED